MLDTTNKSIPSLDLSDFDEKDSCDEKNTSTASVKQTHVDDLNRTSFVDDLQNAFDTLSHDVFNNLSSGEELALNLDAENSTFIRFSQGKIRQCTDVKQADVSLSYRTKALDGNNVEIHLQMPLSLDCAENKERALTLLRDAKNMSKGFPSDPYLSPLTKHTPSNYNQCFNTIYDLDSVFQKLSPFDAAGLWCSGPILTGHANQTGTKHFFATDQFFLDYSFYTPEQKAVKKLLAGNQLNMHQLDDQLKDAKEALDLFKTPSKTIEPGAYRVYFSPSAVDALITTACWRSLGYGAYKKGDSAFKDLADERKKLSSKITLSQDFRHGLMPRFNAQGDVTPETLTLLDKGELKNWLISERTGKEYGITSNAAFDGDSLATATLDTGHIAKEKILQALGTGLYIDNLHYLNWSDIQGGRITGMTRYACFWVENGKKVAPIKDMRFDETLYHFFGNGLEDLTTESETIVNTMTYFRRSLGANCVPGMIVDGFHFTL